MGYGSACVHVSCVLLAECCIHRGVTNVCQKACKWNVDISELERMDNPLICLGDLNHLVECASGILIFVGSGSIFGTTDYSYLGLCVILPHGF